MIHGTISPYGFGYELSDLPLRAQCVGRSFVSGVEDGRGFTAIVSFPVPHTHSNSSSWRGDPGGIIVP